MNPENKRFQRSQGSLLLYSRNIIVALICFVAVLALAAAYRIPGLEERPVHGDEANQALKTGQLFETGVYHYDPNEHHGPTLYYLTLPALWVGGPSSFADTTITRYRLVPAFFGLALIALLWPMRDLLGSSGMLWAALFFAVSHAMTYYSRYYVQEMLLVCFTQAALAAGWRYLRRPGAGHAALIGICLGLVHATKETSALIAAAMIAALALALAYGRLRDGHALRDQMQLLWPRRTTTHVLIAGAVCLLVSVTLFSSLFSHARGPLDSLLTYGHYFARTEGTGTAGLHDKPWHYYLGLLAYTYRQAGPRWSEAPTLVLALAGALVILLRKKNNDKMDLAAWQGLFFCRLLVFYTLAATAIYSIIPYKTPWNLLVFYHGIILIAGIGAAAVVRAGRWRPVRAMLCLALLASACFMGRQSYQGNFVYPADTRNPWVYAHPATSLRRLTARIDDIAAASGEDKALHINIIRPDGDYWPLPWYLRGFTQVGWWHRLPERADAMIILAAPELYEALQESLREEYMVEFHALRPGVLLHTYIRQDLWDLFMETRR